MRLVRLKIQTTNQAKSTLKNPQGRKSHYIFTADNIESYLNTKIGWKTKRNVDVLERI